jgi:hypothetical protein
MSDIVNRSYYNPEYHRDYYQKNKQKIIERAKERWAKMSDKEREEYYEGLKKQRRKLKK